MATVRSLVSPPCRCLTTTRTLLKKKNQIRDEEEFDEDFFEDPVEEEFEDASPVPESADPRESFLRRVGLPGAGALRKTEKLDFTVTGLCKSKYKVDDSTFIERPPEIKGVLPGKLLEGVVRATSKETVHELLYFVHIWRSNGLPVTSNLVSEILARVEELQGAKRALEMFINHAYYGLDLPRVEDGVRLLNAIWGEDIVSESDVVLFLVGVSLVHLTFPRADVPVVLAVQALDLMARCGPFDVAHWDALAHGHRASYAVDVLRRATQAGAAGPGLPAEVQSASERVRLADENMKTLLDRL